MIKRLLSIEIEIRNTIDSKAIKIRVLFLQSVICVLDIMLPNVDGNELCRSIRKPFSMEELIAGIKNQLHLASNRHHQQDGQLRIGKYILSSSRYELVTLKGIGYLFLKK
jgi:DNA-binding response OmpR family regulator